jgi:hypothetical protein
LSFHNFKLSTKKTSPSAAPINRKQYRNDCSVIGNLVAVSMRLGLHLTFFIVAFVASRTVAFSLWPQPVIVDSHEPIPEDREGFVRRFFRWLGFLRPPIFGFTAYNHLDLGEPGVNFYETFYFTSFFSKRRKNKLECLYPDKLLWL